MRFFLVDKIVDLEAGKRITGVKNVTMSENFLEQHFHMTPVMPGSLIMEALAQLSGKLLSYTSEKEFGNWGIPLLTMVDRLRFRKFVHPGESILLHSEVEEFALDVSRLNTWAKVNSEKVASAEMTFKFFDEEIIEEVQKHGLPASIVSEMREFEKRYFHQLLFNSFNDSKNYEKLKGLYILK